MPNDGSWPFNNLWMPLYADGLATAPEPPWQDQWGVQTVIVTIPHSDDAPFSDGAPYTMTVEI